MEAIAALAAAERARGKRPSSTMCGIMVIRSPCVDMSRSGKLAAEATQGASGTPPSRGSGRTSA